MSKLAPAPSSAIPLVMLGLLAPLTSGCGDEACSDCTDSGQGKIWRHPEPIIQTHPYVLDQRVKISGANGKIVVLIGSSYDLLEARFDRFTVAAQDASDAAMAEMEQQLELSTILGGSSTIEVTSIKKSGASLGVGSDVTVTLPTSFSGGITVLNSNGSTDMNLRGTKADFTTVANDNGRLSILGAGGQIDVSVTTGTTAELEVVYWPVETGLVKVNVSALTFTVGPYQDGSIDASSHLGVVHDPNPWPGGWSAGPQNSPTDKSFVFGEEPYKGGTIDLDNSGDIIIHQG